MSDASALSDVGGLHAERSWRVSRFLLRLGTSDCRGSVQQRLPGHGTQNSGVSTLDVEMSSGSGSISGSGGSDSVMGPGSDYLWFRWFRLCYGTWFRLFLVPVVPTLLWDPVPTLSLVPAVPTLLWDPVPTLSLVLAVPTLL